MRQASKIIYASAVLPVSPLFNPRTVNPRIVNPRTVNPRIVDRRDSTVAMNSTERFLLKMHVLKRAYLTPLQLSEIDNAIAAHSQPEEFTQVDLERMRQQIDDHWNRINASPNSFMDFVNRLDIFAHCFVCLLIKNYYQDGLSPGIDRDRAITVTAILSIEDNLLHQLLRENADFAISELCMNRQHIEYRLRCGTTFSLSSGGDRKLVVEKDKCALQQLVAHNGALEPARGILERPMQRLTSQISSGWASFMGIFGAINPNRESDSLQSFAATMAKKQI